MAHLSNRLRQLRKQRGLTQKELEALSGVPQNTISRIEIGGVQEISTKTLIGLARALHVTTDCLLGLDGPEGAEVNATEATPPATPKGKRQRTRKAAPVA
jgi:transcriptional regulator with XRE-family HTH domain